ncbi:MAG: hypothetical protein HC919_15125 [Oscillatoriales cyanobacterium SM2_2_1]|nr:hypothetical protein [Oscillatoriales cyanobacterium SM2_2_1]
MSSELANILDLSLGWKRVKRDVTSNRVFIKHPYEILLIEQDLESWLNKIRQSMEENSFSPSPAPICEIPKPRSGIRPGSHICMRDRVVYAACIEAIYSSIYDNLTWSQGKIDFSYQLLPPEKKSNSWFKSKFAWKDFNDDTKSKIDKGDEYIVVADICGYYENINLEILLCELQDISSQKELVTVLRKCLMKWADQNSGKGIPQGYSASDILGKLYLNYIDYHLYEEGLIHTSWVDDFRIFCTSLSQARQVVMFLTGLLRERGLNLQSAKTEICKSEKLLSKIHALEDRLKPLVKLYTQKALSLVAEEDNPYMPMYRIDRVFSSNPEEAPIKAIQEAFKLYFEDSPEDENFDKSAFRFLLKRLGAVKDKFALEYCKNIFVTQPQETETILEYFRSVDGYALVEDTLVDFLSSEDCIYDYQNYQIIEWICNLSVQPSNKLLTLVRKFLWGESIRPLYLRSVCWYFIDKYGSKYDLERAKNSYPSASDQLEQCDMICAMRRLHKSRKDDFFRRIDTQSDMHSRAIKYANK